MISKIKESSSILMHDEYKCKKKKKKNYFGIYTGTNYFTTFLQTADVTNFY